MAKSFIITALACQVFLDTALRLWFFFESEERIFSCLPFRSIISDQKLSLLDSAISLLAWSISS